MNSEYWSLVRYMFCEFFPPVSSLSNTFIKHIFWWGKIFNFEHVQFINSFSFMICVGFFFFFDRGKMIFCLLWGYNDILFKNCGGSEVLSYLQANKLKHCSFMDAVRISNTQVSNVKDFICQETINSINIHIFLSNSFDPQIPWSDMDGPKLESVSSEGGVTKEKLRA